MIAVRILHRGADQIITIVRELRARGLVQGVDFDFAHHGSRWDEMIGEIPRQTVFSFYKESEATMFALKYGFNNSNVV